MEKPEGNRTLGSPNVRWENNINRMEAIPLCSLLNKLHLFSLRHNLWYKSQVGVFHCG